jgi:hypothetical protein
MLLSFLGSSLLVLGFAIISVSQTTSMYILTQARAACQNHRHHLYHRRNPLQAAIEDTYPSA